jgi:hypothetical protein
VLGYKPEDASSKPDGVKLALGFTQSLTEMSTGNNKKIMFLGSKVRLVRGADNPTAILSRLSRQYGILNISQLYRSPRPVKGIYFKALGYKLEGRGFETR